jgi:hypothetical protein
LVSTVGGASFRNSGVMNPIYVPAGTVAMSQDLFIYQQCAMMGCHGKAVLPFTRRTMTTAEERLLNELTLATITLPVGSALNVIKGASTVAGANRVFWVGADG